MTEKWQADLMKLQRALEAALGPRLVALLMYGSAARPGASGPRSDVNLLLVVRDASCAGLRLVAEAVAGWVRAGYTPPLIFGESEWRASADVFPIEIEDMREAHRLLAGGDPFAGLATTAADLRGELEREVRSKLLHLRTAYAGAAPSGKALEGLLEASSGTVLALLRAAVRLTGNRPPAEPAAQVAAAARIAGFDAKVFEWVLARRAGSAATRLTPYDSVATGYVDAVQRLADWVDEAGRHLDTVTGVVAERSPEAELHDTREGQ